MFFFSSSVYFGPWSSRLKRLQSFSTPALWCLSTAVSYTAVTSKTPRGGRRRCHLSASPSPHCSVSSSSSSFCTCSSAVRSPLRRRCTGVPTKKTIFSILMRILTERGRVSSPGGAAVACCSLSVFVFVCVLSVIGASECLNYIRFTRCIDCTRSIQYAFPTECQNCEFSAWQISCFT